MRYYTHVAAAVLFFLVFAFLFNIENGNLLAGILITAVVSVMPDLLELIIDGEHRGYGHSLLLWIPALIITGVLSFIIGNMVILIGVFTAVVSHILLDLITRNGYRFLYPKKTVFVALNKKRRFKTGTKQDKAVFIFLVLLLIPALVFSFNILSLAAPNSVQAQELPSNNTSYDQSVIKENVDVNIDSKMKNTNISIEKVNENKTLILVQDIKE